MRYRKEPVFLIGYDVEAQEEKEWRKTRRFLKLSSSIHRELNIPCTFFICGKTLENNQKEFIEVREQFSDLIDFQQHTYSHIRLKEIRYHRDTPLLDPEGKEVYPEGETVFEAGNPQQIKEEVKKTNKLLKEILGVTCTGLTAPYGAPKGLMDRGDLLYILQKEGIKFIRSWNGREDRWDPINATPLTIQPFFYGGSGYPEIMEFPIHLMDNVNRERYGWSNHLLYFGLVKAKMEKAMEGRLVFSYLQHDHSSVTGDEEMELTYKILETAKKMGFQFYTYWHYYLKERAKSKLSFLKDYS